MKKRRLSSVSAIVLAAICGSILWLFLLGLLHIAPFGDRTLMTIDAYHQYAPFHAELKQKILEGGSLFYSWSSGMGKDFLGQVAYYTLSPLSLLPVLLPEEKLLLAMDLMIVLKSLLTIISAAFFLEKLNTLEKNELSRPFVVILALSYSFSGFFAAFYWNVMWLDAMALLPLFLLGLYELSLGLGKWRFLLTLVALFITNYFMGVIILLCSLPAYAALIVQHHTRSEWKPALLRLVRFIALTLLAIGLSYFVLSPARGSLGTTDALGLTVENPLGFFSRFGDVLVQHLMGATPAVVILENPHANAYSGLLCLLLAPLYFTLREIRVKKKIIAGLLFIFFFLCMNNELFDYIIHGFHINKMLPHRFAFLYTMFFVLMARRVLLLRSTLKRRHFAYSIAAIAAIAILSVIVFPDKAQTAKITYALLAIDMLLLIVYSALILLEGKYKNLARIVSVALLVLICLELGCNQKIGIAHSRTNENGYYTLGRESINKIAEFEDHQGFYRAELFPQITNNDGALYGYKAMATFNSIINLDTSNLLRDLGYPAGPVSYQFADNTPFMTSLLNIRYLYDRTNRGEGFLLLEKTGNMKLYENETVLPLGFFVSPDALQLHRSEEHGGPFALQNKLAAALSGEAAALLHSAEQLGFMGENIELTPLENQRFSYALTEPERLDRAPVAEIYFTASHTGAHWLALDSTHCDFAEAITPKGMQFIEMGKTNQITGIGALEKGDLVRIRLHFSYRYENQAFYFPSGDFGVYLAGFDYGAFDALYSLLSQSPLENIDYTDNTVRGRLHAEAEGLAFFSIPYGEGWTAQVDGEDVKPISLFDGAFLALELTEGAHEIYLEYQTPGWQKGLTVTAISIVVLMTLLIWEQHKKRRDDL